MVKSSLITLIRATFISIVLLTTVPNLYAASVPAVVSYTFPVVSHPASSSSYWSLGYQFTVNTDIFVTALGYFDFEKNGLAASHPVAIWNDSGGSPLASVAVPSGTDGALIGDYRYADLTSVLTLSSGTYRIAAEVLKGLPGDDPYIYGASDLVMHPFVAYSTSCYTGSTKPGVHFPSILWSGCRYLQPNFLLQPVPIPGAVWLLGSGLIGIVGIRKKFKK